MKNSTLTAQQVVTPKVVCDELILGGTKLTKIAEDYETADRKALINKEMLESALLDIKIALKSIDPDGDLFQDLATISLSQVDSYFNIHDDFILKNWEFADNSAKCIGNEPDNSLTINPKAFAQPGTYLITANFSEIPSGYAELRKNNEWVATFREVGQTTVSFTIDDISTDTISFVGIDVNKNESIVIDRLSVYYVTDRLNEYIGAKTKAQISIDSASFVKKDDYLHDRDKLTNEVEAQTTRYLAELNAHEIAVNPHNITPDLIGAAKVDHTHSEYISQTEVDTIIKSKLSDYAKVDHTHDNYLTKDESETLVNDAMTKQLANMVTIPPAIITDAPMGLLPSRLSQSGLTPPITVILPSLINPVNNSSFDIVNGVITTNKGSLVNEAPKLFALDNTYAKINKTDIQSSATFRMQFHAKRTISSYTVKCKNGKLTDWKVFSGNTTFIHRVTNPTNYQSIDETNTCSITFPDPIEVDSIAFILLDATADLEIKISLTLSDTSISNILLTKESFGVCVPTNGANRIVTYPAVDTFRKVAALPVTATKLPCYIFAKAELNSTPYFTTSYYPPEYGNIRKGIDIFSDKFQSNLSNPGSDNTSEAYTSDVYGTLSLIDGASNPDTPLTYIYNGTDSWYSKAGVNRAVIEQTIKSDDVLLMGYTLFWKKEDADYVPKSWTLTVNGIDETGNEVSVVYDSVDVYYPFYSVEDDDIVYHADFDQPIRVRKLILTVETDRNDGVVSLYNLAYFLSERFYSIPENKMYKGNKEVSETCIGSAVYGDNGWTPVNTCLGRFCVVPINNMQVATNDTTYTVPNPFLSTDIQVSIKCYGTESNFENADVAPGAAVTDITSDTITVVCKTSYIYALAISRAW